MTNCYEILNIRENASEREIKIAYRRLAIKYHPDKNKSINAKQKFIEIKSAYDILSNPNKRLIHDNQLFAFKTVNKEIKEDNRYNSSENKLDKKNGSKKCGKYFFYGIAIIILFFIIYLIKSNNNLSLENQNTKSKQDSSQIETQQIHEKLKNVEPTQPHSGELKF